VIGATAAQAPCVRWNALLRRRVRIGDFLPCGAAVIGNGMKAAE